MHIEQKQFPASGCLARIVIIAIIALLIWCNKGFGQVNKQQDSIIKVQQEADRFVDSLLSKITMKDFEKFLDEQVPAKQTREGTYMQLKGFFLQAKYNEWMQRKKQPKN